MSYELTDRIIAIDPNVVEALLSDLTEQYGEPLPDGKDTIVTIGAHWDDSAKTRLRAASLNKGTISGQELTDGRIAFRCLWQSDLAKDFDAGKINGVVELGEEELKALTPIPEEQSL